MTECYKLIRYNTGTDKKLFTEFAKDYDAVIMNATIAAYSGSAMADLVSIYKDSYIIDPQTYILQQNIETLKSTTSKKEGIKKSIVQYLKQLPEVFLQSLNTNGNIDFSIIEENIDQLVQSVGDFQLLYIKSFIKKKEYNKYLEFISEASDANFIKDPQPKLLIAPYFMIKSSYGQDYISKWMGLNQRALNTFIAKFSQYNYPIAAQLVLEKGALEKLEASQQLDMIVNSYQNEVFDYIFIWVDDFSPIESDISISRTFANLIKKLNAIGKKPIISYGGYDSIILCHKDSPTRLYGVAQSVGYGEKRQITPVGGGLPVNKFYFPPTHQRLNTEQVSQILFANGYFDSKKTKKIRAEEFYAHICSCDQCQDIIKEDFDNFYKYNMSTPFTMRNGINRNRPTQEALDIAARHFLYNKRMEWQEISREEFATLIDKYKLNIDKYGRYYDRNLYSHVNKWIENYAK